MLRSLLSTIIRALIGAAALGLLTITVAHASLPVPSGAALSLPALRQAYLGAVKARSPETLATLFDLSEIPLRDRAAFEKEKFQDLDQVVSATIIDPDPHILAAYKQSHVTLGRPIVKMLQISLAASARDSLTTDYLITTQDDRYFFILARPGR